MRARLALGVVVASLGVLTFAVPSGAVVHEIIGQWCSGRTPLDPAGIGDPTKQFAQRLFAAGVATFVPNFDGQGNNVIQFNFDHPAIKIVSAGDPVPLAGNP